MTPPLARAIRELQHTRETWIEQQRGLRCVWTSGETPPITSIPATEPRHPCVAPTVCGGQRPTVLRALHALPALSGGSPPNQGAGGAGSSVRAAPQPSNCWGKCRGAGCSQPKAHEHWPRCGVEAGMLVFARGCIKCDNCRPAEALMQNESVGDGCQPLT